MDFKLLALDLDNTLLNAEHTLTDETINIIKKLQDKGLDITIATGRMLCSSLPYIKQLGIKGPVITYNGALVKDISRDYTLYHQPIKFKIARDIISTAEKAGLHLNLYQDDKLFVAERNDLVRIYEEIAGIKAREVGSLNNFIEKSPTKLLIIEEDRGRKKKFLNYFKENYRGKLAVTESKERFIEFMAAGVSKGKALQQLAESKGVSSQQVIAIGDGWNDAEMIEWAGLGIAMDNAPKGVKSKADRIAPHHDREGAAQILKNIFQ